MNEPLLRWFHFEHLPVGLKEVSEKFHDLAVDLCSELPNSVERSVGIRKLLEAKDCMVRAKREQIGGEPAKTEKLS